MDPSAAKLSRYYDPSSLGPMYHIHVRNTIRDVAWLHSMPICLWPPTSRSSIESQIFPTTTSVTWLHSLRARCCVVTPRGKCKTRSLIYMNGIEPLDTPKADERSISRSRAPGKPGRTGLSGGLFVSPSSVWDLGPNNSEEVILRAWY